MNAHSTAASLCITALRAISRGAAAFGIVAMLMGSHGVAQASPGLDCASIGSCLPDNADPSKRDGFALRLSIVQLTQSPAAGMGGVSSQMPPKSLDAQQSAAVMFGCDGLYRDMPFMLFAETNKLAVAGRFDTAQARYTKLLSKGERDVEPQLEAAALANLGVVAAAQGRYAEAKDKLEQALKRYQDQEAAPVLPAGGPSKAAFAEQLARLGIKPGMVDLNAAMAPLADMQKMLQTRAASAGVFRILLNLGNLFGQLGQYADAEAQLKLALTQSAKMQDPNLERLVFAEFAVLYRKTGKSEAAAEYSRRAVGPALPAESIGLLGNDLIALGRSTAPAPTTSLSAEAEQNRPSHYAEAAQLRMQAEAQQYERAGDMAAAAIVYSRGATLAASVSTPEREHAALADLARVHAATSTAELAIFSGKRAVNAAQHLRVEVLTMERQARQAYLADKKRSYTTLAGLLLQQGRLAEAEHVLRLLKEDEGQQFRQTLKSPAQSRGVMPYSLVEAKYESRYEALASQTRELEAQRQALQCGMFGGGAMIDDRSQQERWRIDTVLQTDSMIRQMETGTQRAKLADQASRARTIVATPASARSTADRQFLQQYQQALLLFTDIVAGMGASLSSVRRDGQFFLQPLSAADAAKIDALANRVASLQAGFAPLTSFLANEPAPPPLPQVQEKQLSQFLSFGMGQTQGSWAIDRQLEGLDAERGRLDAELLDAMGGKKRAAEPVFTPADATLLDTGRKLLGALPPGTVAIYYLSGEQQLDMLVVSRDGRTTLRQPVTRSQLEQRIQAFRQVLQNPRMDPTAPAKALYDILIGPMAGALHDAKATTLMLALDGQLRYLPFAALHDGQAWLAERYAVDLYTTAAPAALTAAPAPRWRAAAFGSTAGGEGFSPLPAVRAELEGVVRDPGMKTQGALPGVIRLDRSFTAAALRAALREKQNVVHIASHFAFRAGDAGASFLLLGDGSRLTLADMAGPDYRFDQVDLVTLSACETALSGDDNFGQEVEGLGTLLQGQGAAAVLATLWSVADDSTAKFMRALYGQREQRGLSRAQAVREVQLTFIRGGAASTTAGDTQRGASRPGDAGTVAAFRADPGRPWAHPYFWAPFVLMGNWL
jgi:CHAT domain-containing protein